MAGTVRVLHVDDDPDFLNMAATYLERIDTDLDVQTATTAQAALDCLETHEIDCIISDYDMPKTDGLELLEDVRSTHQALPFILFTGMGSEEVASEAISAGVTDYLQKGSGTEQYELLANRIENAVTQHEAEQRATVIDQRLRELTEATDDIFWMFDADWQELLFINSAYETIWGRSIDALEANPQDFLNGIHPDDRDRVQDAMAKLSGGEPVEIEYRVNEAENYQRWVWVEAVPLTDDAGTVQRIAGFVRDISDRKAREAELERKNRAMDEAPIGITLTDPTKPDNPLIYANQSFLDLTGYDEADILDENWSILHGEETDSDTVAVLRDAIEAEETTSVELRNYRADGTTFWNRVTVAPVYDSHGTLTNYVGFQRDVTDRKRQQQQLRDQKAKIEALHEVATSISTYDTNQAIYEELVDAAREILAYDIVIVDEAHDQLLIPQAESSTLDAEQYYEETPIDADHNLAAKAYRTGEPSLVDDLQTLDVAPADSTFRSALTVPIGDFGVFQTVSRSPNAYDQEDLELVELLVAHARETLTRLKEQTKLRARTDELEQKNNRLDEFASLVSHDLRNPLNLARGHLELAQEECTNDHLATVDQAHERMDELIADLLKLTRHGDRITDPDTIPLTAVADACWSTLETGETTLQIDVSDDWTIAADHSRLQQLLENLVRNAIEHGSQTITIGSLDNGFYVADDGPGIPVEERSNVLEYGYSTREEGAGLGLAIVAQIADDHGWTVDITESAAGGARFEFRGMTEEE